MKNVAARALAIITALAAITNELVSHDLPAPDSHRKAVVVPPGAGSKTGRTEWKLLGSQSNGALALAEITIPAGQPHPGPELHRHTRDDEGWYVIEGELTLEVDGETITAGPGTLVWAPKNIPHRYHASKLPARYLRFHSPAGMDKYFHERSDLEKRFPPGSPEREAAVAEAQQRYGTEVVKPSPEKQPSRP